MESTRSSSLSLSLLLELLDDRLVPANVIDLTYPDAEGTASGAIFRQTDAQPTGTGFIDSFVRIQTNATLEQGFNTGGRPLQFDENRSPQFTRSITLGEVPMVSYNGGLYREFLLDINQRAATPLLSLDDVVVFISDEPDLLGYDPAGKTLAGNAPVFDLDQSEDNCIKLDARLNSGSGSGDMTMLIPASRFGADPTKFVYLYSAFGRNHANNGGFEEWAVRESTPDDGPPPVEPASLSGFVFEDLNFDGLLNDGDVPIFAARITLTGINDLGQNVVLTALSGNDGAYSFTGLRPGIYSLLEDQPAGYDDGNDYVGSQGGVADNDYFFDIFLAEDVDGVNYNFTEILSNPNS